MEIFGSQDFISSISMHRRERTKDSHVVVSNYRTHVFIYNKDNLPTGNHPKSKQYTGLMNSTCLITWEKGTGVKGRFASCQIVSNLISHSLK